MAIAVLLGGCNGDDGDVATDAETQAKVTCDPSWPNIGGTDACDAPCEHPAGSMQRVSDDEGCVPTVPVPVVEVMQNGCSAIETSLWNGRLGCCLGPDFYQCD